MKTMCQEIICIAAPTPRVLREYPAYGEFFPRLQAALAEFHSVCVLELPDIWVRDFLPLQHRQTGALSRLLFRPRYANYTPKFTAEINAAVRRLFPVRECMVQIDGGNILSGPDGTVFCLQGRRIFRQSADGEQEIVEDELFAALGEKKLVWLPREIGDKIGHIDGFMQFIGDTLFVSDERFDPYLERLLWRRLELVRRVYWNLKFRFLPCVPDRADPGGLSARGVYVNFLDTSKAVFVPQYGLEADLEAIRQIQAAAPGKPVIGIECAEIARYGGALHCVTKNYWLDDISRPAGWEPGGTACPGL